MIDGNVPAGNDSEDPVSAHRFERHLFVGVIVWSDDPEVEPTVIGAQSPVAVARIMGNAIYEMLTDSDALAGATEFLEEHPRPDRSHPENVDAWLDALRNATPYPAYSFHQLPLASSADGDTNVRSLSIEQQLRDRERALTAEASELPPDDSHHAPGRTI